MIVNGSKLAAAAALSPMVPAKERAPSYAWHPNSYTDLHARLIGPDTGADSTGLFPSGWTPETETGRAANMEGE